MPSSSPEVPINAVFAKLLQDPTNTVARDMFGQIIEAIPSAIRFVLLNKDGQPLDVWRNSQAMTLLGEDQTIPLENLDTKQWARWFHPLDITPYQSVYADILHGDREKPFNQIFRILDQDTRENDVYEPGYLWISEDIMPIIDPSTHTLIAISSGLQDVTKIGKLAYLDPLTGLNNRSYVQEYWVTEYNRAKRDKKPMGILFCDLDHLKEVNDQKGHQEGDLAIIAVADFLKKDLRDYEMLARWGGDEFVILSRSDRRGTRKLANRLHIGLQETGLGLTMSTGFYSTRVDSLSSDPAEAYDILIRRADNALYEAKAAGRNCVREYIVPRV